jgi:hypothetical protein
LFSGLLALPEYPGLKANPENQFFPPGTDGKKLDFICIRLNSHNWFTFPVTEKGDGRVVLAPPNLLILYGPVQTCCESVK